MVASAPAGIVYNPENWSLPIDDLDVGDVATIRLPVHVSPATPLGQGLTHTLSASALTADPAPGLSTSVVPIGILADLAVDSFTTTEQRGPGNDLQLALEGVGLTNHGPDDVSAFAVAFECGSQLIRIPTLGGSSGRCTSAFADVCPLHCVIGPLRSGERVILGFQIVLIQVRATVSSDPATPYLDPNPSNDKLLGEVYRPNPIFDCGLF